MYVFSLEIKCYSCKKVFRVDEGTEEYKQYKKNRNGLYCCEECNEKIRLEAILDFFRGNG
ncbi:DUF2197 domain-containing protein [Paenibacillus sp. GYB003]